MTWIPDMPTFRRECGKDGKLRLYLVANNPIDIELMLRLAECPPGGIHEQHDAFLQGYYRIIKSWEEKLIKRVFP